MTDTVNITVQGMAGLSAYELAVRNGYTGSLADFVASGGANLQPQVDAANAAKVAAQTAQAAAEAARDTTAATVDAKTGHLTAVILKAKPEQGIPNNGWRFQIGNREYMTFGATNGLHIRKGLLSSTAIKVDDAPTISIGDRLLGAGLGGYFKQIGQEASGGGALRIAWGTRLLARWDQLYGFAPTRMLLPVDTKIADQPGVKLLDRISSGAPAAANTNFVVTAAADTGGKLQLTSRRRSDGATFTLTSGAYSSRYPSLTSDDNVIFFSEQQNRYMWTPAIGGAIWPVDPDTTIDAWGDSLTNGTGNTIGNYETRLFAKMSGVVSAINNRGIGGQNANEIAARQNGVRMVATFPSNQIPASGSVTLSSWSTSPITSQGASTQTGYFVDTSGNKIPGTLSATGFDGNGRATGLSFARTTAGSVATVATNTPFTTDLGEQTQTLINFLIYGRNNTSSPSQTATTLAGSVAYLKAYSAKYLIGLVLAAPVGQDTPATIATIDGINATTIATYGNRVVDTNSAPTTEEMATLAQFNNGTAFVPDSYGVYSLGRTDDADLNGKASGYYAFNGQPSNADTVTIGSNTIQFVTSGATGAKVLIGANAAATATNLASYINTNSSTLAATAVAGTTATGSILCIVTSTVPGTGSNSIAFSASSTNVVASGSTMSGGATAGRIPSGMRNGATTGNGDFLHGNDFMYALWALRFYRKVVALGWFPSLPVI